MTEGGSAGGGTGAAAGAVDAFLAGVAPPARQADARSLCALLGRLSGETPTMWGGSIVGFGRYRYRYDSGREGEAPRIGFSPRSTALVLYLPDSAGMQDELLTRLGKHKAGKGCIYIKKLSDLDQATLESLISTSLAEMARRYPES